MASTNTDFADWQNSVLLVGRVTSEADEIELPSGETLVRFRIVVPRDKPTTKTTVDTIDCVTFKTVSQRKVRTLAIGDLVEITGELRRRFWKAGTGVASRVEVEISSLKSVK
ncbi:MAG: single-stranded DNA-binding protein [Actinobacteria bacterium]|nr:single-stranded DNA-binding protein [Actinomycetota bacterium]